MHKLLITSDYQKRVCTDLYTKVAPGAVHLTDVGPGVGGGTIPLPIVHPRHSIEST